MLSIALIVVLKDTKERGMIFVQNAAAVNFMLLNCAKNAMVLVCEVETVHTGRAVLILIVDIVIFIVQIIHVQQVTAIFQNIDW